MSAPKRARVETEADSSASTPDAGASRGWNALSEERLGQVVSNFQDRKDFKLDDGSEVVGHPFGACRLRNLFDESVLEAAREAITKEATFTLKSNDLYKFHQSLHDFQSTKSAALQRLRDVIYSQEFRGMISRIVGVPLSDRVDLSAARYAPTDYLLCHDDQLDGRRVAFIVYLVSKDWTEADGGALDLFDSDEHSQPKSIVRSLVPEWNSFAFFEVTATSYHQVAEVLSSDPSRERVSISGWFHTDARIPAAPRWLEPPEEQVPFEKSEDKIPDWINKAYLDPTAISRIGAAFIEDSMVSLRGFLTTAAHEQLIQHLLQMSKDFVHVGPWNRRHFGRLPSFSSPFASFLSSTEFRDFLRSITSLNTIATHSKPRATRFGPSEYSLIHDDALEPPAIDIVYFADAPDVVDDVTGGHLVYMAEDETLLTVEPTPNTLLVVMRDAGVFRFHKFRSATGEKQKDTMIVAMECNESESS